MKEKIIATRLSEVLVKKDGSTQGYGIADSDVVASFITGGYGIVEHNITKNYELFTLEKPINGYMHREFLALKLKDTGDNERIATIIDRIAMRTTYACTQEEKALLKKYGIKRRGKSLVFNAEYLPFQGGGWSDKRFKCDYVNWISTRGTREYAKEIRWYKYGARSFQGAEREYESKHPPKMFEKYKELKETIECEKENLATWEQNKEERHNAIMKQLKSSDEFYSSAIKETRDRLELARSAVREFKAK